MCRNLMVCNHPISSIYVYTTSMISRVFVGIHTAKRLTYMDLQKMASPKAKKNTSTECTAPKSLQQMSPKEYRLCTSAERKAFEPGATVFFGWLGANPDLKKKKQCSKTAAWAHENWWFELLLILYPKCERNISWLFPPTGAVSEVEPWFLPWCDPSQNIWLKRWRCKQILLLW